MLETLENGDVLLADRAYDSDALRIEMAARGAWANMKPMLLFGAVMAITQAFGVCDVPMALAGYPSTDYAARTVVTHLFDYGFSRFEMGYASAIATLLFLVMILCKKFISAALEKVGT